MAALESCLKHNMVAYLEKTEGNAEFHEFWTSAKSKIVNNVRYINAKVAGKPVTVSEASIRSSLLFDDANGIDSLNNQAIFDVIQSMGYEGDLTILTFNKALFSPQWRFLFHTMNHCISSKSTSWDQIPTNIATVVICLTTHQKYNFSKLIFDGMIRHLDAKKKFVMYLRFISILLGTQLKNIHVPLDHFPVNALTSKVFSFMVKKGKHFSGKVTPLFPSMLVQLTDAEGEVPDRPSEPKSPEEEGEALANELEPQPTPSPSHQPTELNEPQTDPSPDLTPPIPDSIPQGDGGTTGDQSSNDKSLSGTQALEIKALKAQVKKLKRKANPLLKHHKAWVRATKLKKKRGEFKQRRKVVKSSKGEPSVHKDSAFDELNDDVLNEEIDYQRTEEIQGEDNTALHQSTEGQKVSTDSTEISTDAQNVSTDIPKVSIDSTKVSTDQVEEGTDELKEDEPKDQTPIPTAPITTATFGDDETIAKV
ncbi:hypothetical protein Tco_1378806, partial [Tanacetum coccineum]